MEALVDQYLAYKSEEADKGSMDLDIHMFEVTAIYTFSKYSLLLPLLTHINPTRPCMHLGCSSKA